MTDSKKALIIGASRGIGLGIVNELAERGWQVTGTTRNAAPAGSAGSAEWLKLDINKADERTSFKDALSDRQFDLIFVNAGAFGPEHQDASLASDEELIQLFMTNAFSPVRCARELLPLLAPKTGIMALMTSELSSLNENPSCTYPVYSASKAALNMLTRALKETTDQHGQTLLSIHPGWVQTDMGGENATLTIAESTQGIADVFAAWRGKGGHHFVEYSGRELRW